MRNRSCGTYYAALLILVLLRLVILVLMKTMDDQNQVGKHFQDYTKDFHVSFIFSKVKNDSNLQAKLNLTFGSLFEHAKFDNNETLHLHFVCDEEGRDFVKDFLQRNTACPSFAYEAHFYLTGSFSQHLYPLVNKVQTALGERDPSYEETIYFLSIVLHKILPDNVNDLVQLDPDLKLVVNIRDIWKEFKYFSHNNIIGLAHENQPVYRHLLRDYHRHHPDTTLGNPLPTGNPGFNSGVILLKLQLIRASFVYNSFFDEKKMTTIAKRYSFEGYLHDQDFYTLLSFEHPELFYALDCVWNRQLCTWWKSKGYEDIFDLYFRCDNEVKIWHGNQNTPIP